MNESTTRSRKKSKDTLKKNENENTTIQNLWDTGRAIQKGKFIAPLTYIKKKEK